MPYLRASLAAALASQRGHGPQAFFLADSPGPNDWAITDEAFLTAVVVHKGKVAASLGYVSVNETEVAKVEEALKKAVGE